MGYRHNICEACGQVYNSSQYGTTFTMKNETSNIKFNWIATCPDCERYFMDMLEDQSESESEEGGNKEENGKEEENSEGEDEGEGFIKERIFRPNEEFIEWMRRCYEHRMKDLEEFKEKIDHWETLCKKKGEEKESSEEEKGKSSDKKRKWDYDEISDS